MNISKNLEFNKPTKTSEQNVNDVSRISQGAAIRGDLASASDIRVDGQVDGSLFSEGKIVVGESARLSGKMFCSNVDFWGKMDGDIFVRDVLSLKSSSIVNGNIHVRKIQVEMGAQINGSFKMITEQEYEQLVATMVRKPQTSAKSQAAAASKPAPAPASKFAAAPSPKPSAPVRSSGHDPEAPATPSSTSAPAPISSSRGTDFFGASAPRT